MRRAFGQTCASRQCLLLLCLAIACGDGPTASARGTALTIQQLASGAASGAAFSTQPSVAIVDANGAVVSSDNRTDIVMTVSAGGVIVGSSSARVQNGIATFLTTGIAGATATYQLTFSGSAAVTPVTQPIALPPVTFLALALGEDHSCGLTAYATYCWGDNRAGQLGTGQPGNSARPTGVARTSPLLVAITAGAYHTCGLTAAGMAYCWGENVNGELGDGSLTTRRSPTAVLGNHTFTSIAAGGGHTCGITNGGAAFCWGWNGAGQVGLGAEKQTTPFAISGGASFVSLSSGWKHNCAVTSAGAAWCWGYNANGGLGSGMSDAAVPLAVDGGHVFASLSLGWYFSCGLTGAGAALCWGNNSDGQLGDGTSMTFTRTAGSVNGGFVFDRLSAGAGHVCGIEVSGPVRCWGQGLYGQLGTGTDAERLIPTLVAGSPQLLSLEAGSFHTCGVTPAGGVVCWGNNRSGEIGDGTLATRFVATAILPP